MQNVIVRHLSGSKAGQIEQLTLDDYSEITVGRDQSSMIQFDPNKDVQVGRHHAKIVQDPSNPYQFIITDLNSRNGTFVNKQAVASTVRILPGDTVQLGPSGPEFQFDVEPPALAVTLLGYTQPLDEPVPPPAAAPASQAHTETGYSGDASGGNPKPMGRKTMELLIATARSQSRKYMVVGGGVLLTIIAILAGILIYQNVASRQQEASTVESNPGEKDANKKGSKNAGANADPSAGTADVEMDMERSSWRIGVKPYLVLGSGHPGKAASDFDKPDGVAFTPEGLLLATDAKNRRVQIWNVKTGAHLGEFGRSELGGEIVDIAVAPDGTVLVTDQTLNLAYVFVPPKPGEVDEKGKELGPYDYQFKGTRFGEQGFDKLGGIAIDSRGRTYVVDAHLNDVRRFNNDFTPDRSWKFDRTRSGDDTYLHGCEGIAIDEGAGNLYIASEKDAVIEVFDWETGAYKNKLIGADIDASGAPSGKHIFFGSVEGITIADHHLLAVDESAGHVQIFDLSRSDVANNGLAKYAPTLQNRSGGYKGFFGHTPIVNFEDKNNKVLQQQVKDGSIIPGQANPPGYFCSPDSIASYADGATGEYYIAIADQCNYRLVVYRWTDIRQSLSNGDVAAESKPNMPPPAVSTANSVAKVVDTASSKPVVKRAVSPRPAQRVVRSADSSRKDASKKSDKKDAEKQSSKDKDIKEDADKYSSKSKSDKKSKKQ
jgi:pSer/pThr/pTyr-binding forkhead associated (FHA) protein